MFSVNAKPVAVIPAITTPSTMPWKRRRRSRNSSSTAVPLQDSSTSGATNVAPQESACLVVAVSVVASRCAAKLLARIAISVAAQEPHANAKIRCPHGCGSTRSIQKNVPMSSGTGSTASARPTRKPWVPVCSRTIARITRPHSASTMTMAAARSALLSQKARRGL